ncbi:multifunctional CCA addition/repair protein [Colwellia sp. UCD-KL20]|uniref:multifunctional CCA addition/repair protein n=1 Tax=Colwellia sp. UCD-KL20 TaxID=1917165 RepID=UPI00117895EF|nr:multifunctional CCA addition/repair protein [Colwellia sp. UCD-KL20]
MTSYLVGGAVRDKLLNRKSYDHDYVVVGSSVEQMLSLGFAQVGKDFPVFLHPQTKEEYALARTEKKVDTGYTGFTCDASEFVTIEEDLLRRDLTINAMALKPNGEIIDPYNGQTDLKNRIFRHVSDAFIEDPLRVLRVARFAARYHTYGFTIAKETMALMTQISQSNELQSLSSERIFTELNKSLLEDNPEVFFETLKACGALKALLPEIDTLWGIPNPALWHPEICSGLHTMMVLQQAVKLSKKPEVRFAALCHDLGKGNTPKPEWPSHRGHEKSGLPLVKNVCNRLRVPNSYQTLALKVCEYHLHCHKAFELKPSTILRLFNALDVWRRPEEFNDFILACTADMRGRTGFEDKEYPQADYLHQCLKAANTITAKVFVEQGLKGKEIKEAIENERLNKITAIKKSANK